jgi:hypothetical protein
MKLHISTLLLLVLSVLPMAGQTPRSLNKSCPDALNAVVQRAAGKLNGELGQFLTFGGAPDCMTTLLLTQYTGTDSLLDRAQQVKAALQQNGSSPGSGSGTSLVSKGITSQILSVATEYGALAETTSGQTVTVSGSLGGIPAALTQKSLIDNCDGIRIPGELCVSDKTVNELNRFSYTVAFNTGSTSQSVSGTAATTTPTTSSAQPVTFNATTNTITSATGKFVILRGAAANITAVAAAVDKLSPTSTAFVTMTADQKKIFNAMSDTYDNMASVKVWKNQTASKILAAAPEGAANVWLQQADALMNAICPPGGDPKCRATLLNQLDTYAMFVNGFKSSVAAFVETVRKAPLFTIEYDFNRPASQPTNSTVRLVGQTVLGGWTLTGNGAVSVYNSTPSSAIPGSSLLRDAQVAAEASFDFSKLKKATLLGHSTGSAAYYFQDQMSPAILNVTPGQPAAGVTITGLPATATQVYAQTGIINIFQGKFTFSPGSSSISLPISFTWSNRSELVANNPLWRGQIGISYDFDSLFGGK